MKRTSALIFLFFIPQIAFATAGVFCEGTEEERIDDLKAIGEYSLRYKEKNGYIPNPSSEYDAKYENGIPKKLRKYMISSNSKLGTIESSCLINSGLPVENSDLEICKFNFSNGSVNCHILSIEKDT